MQVLARSEYAVRACLQLARNGDRPMSAEAVAMHADLPSKFLEAILTELRHAGIVVTQRGPAGGCRLARPPDTVTVADIIRAVDGPLAQVHGVPPEHLGYTGDAEVLRSLWVATRAALRTVLEATTLADLAAGTLPAPVQALLDLPGAWTAR